MSSLLQQLENNEAVLLMYLAGELPPEDRAEVEQMLATDAGLRADLDQMRAAQGQWALGMQALDRVTRLPSSEAVAVRRVGRAMRQWNEARAERPKVPAAEGPRFAWWAYPLTAAAAVVLAFLVWWGNSPERVPVAQSPDLQPPFVVPGRGHWRPGEFPHARAHFDTDQQSLKATIEQSFGPPEASRQDAEAYAWADRVEQELLAISTPQDVTSDIFFIETSETDGAEQDEIN